MNIVIYGTGGVGGYFGARLAQAGNKVTFIARGKHLEVIQNKGLQLKSIKGDYLVNPANATSNISEVKNIDLVLICVKTWQLKEVAEKIKTVFNTI
ncbi:ketopantoate reductase family protein [uncultured Lutibacter sp.]|uniref:ketopantoate reductase family protein n=1 Tax=uncultured Lutibacter sp. TaxID=437739 RepID=UPI00260BAA43|nr:2-dehydropantoate 2-reductase [uncultured Lutibacter sp.]